MRIYEPTSISSVLCSCYGSIFPKVLLRSLLCSCFGGLAYYVSYTYKYDLGSDGDLHQYIAVIIGLLLVFRTNFSYQRWHDGLAQVTTLLFSILG